MNPPYSQSDFTVNPTLWSVWLYIQSHGTDHDWIRIQVLWCQKLPFWQLCHNYNPNKQKICDEIQNVELAESGLQKEVH